MYSTTLSKAALLTLATGALATPCHSITAATPSATAVNSTTCAGQAYSYLSLAAVARLPSAGGEIFNDTLGGIGSSIAMNVSSWALSADGLYTGILRSNVVTAGTTCEWLDINNNQELDKFWMHNGGKQDVYLLNEKWESLAVVPVYSGTESREHFTFSRCQITIL